MSLGKRIRSRRKELGLTQFEVAEQLNMGRSNFGHIENGRVVPTSTDLAQIADILNTHVDYLLERSDKPDKDIKRNSLRWLLSLNEQGYLDVFKSTSHPLLRERFKNATSLEEIVGALKDGVTNLGLSDAELGALEQFGDDLESKILYLQLFSDIFNSNKNLTPDQDTLSSEDRISTDSHSSNLFDKFHLVSIPLTSFIRNTESNPQEVIDYLEVEKDLLEGYGGFALKVQNDDMIGDRIRKGDIVIIKKQLEIEPSDIAVVSMYDNIATLNRVKFEGDMCMLIPSNPLLTPTLIPRQHVHIFGKVIEVRFWLK